MPILLGGTWTVKGEEGGTVAWLTDVDDVALLVQHDVAVVSVLDLQQEQQEAVGGHASDKIVACLCIENHGLPIALAGGDLSVALPSSL